ncbi:MAG: type IV toxin-antitoxin system AbiEi family antitoxin domain-containing protein, partial [Aristaeellaceae bacterium]
MVGKNVLCSLKVPRKSVGLSAEIESGVLNRRLSRKRLKDCQFSYLVNHPHFYSKCGYSAIDNAAKSYIMKMEEVRPVEDRIRKVRNLFAQHGGIMRTSELAANGVYYKLLREFLEHGYIEQIRRGY